MKRIALLLILFVGVVNLYSQTETAKKTIGVHVTPGIYLGMGPAGTFGIGLDYSKKISEKWSFCSGFEQHALGLFNIISYSERPWQITSIPVQLKHHGKYVDFKFGPVVNSFGLFYNKVTTTFILGWEFGVGFEREFNKGIIIYLNPYVRINGIVLSELDGGYRNLHSGVSLGIGKKF